MRRSFGWILLLLLLAACSLRGGERPAPTDVVSAVETSVAITLAAVRGSPTPSRTPLPPTETPAPTVPPAPTAGPTNTPLPTATPPVINVTGRICFPGGVAPALTVYFENTQTKETVRLPVREGSATYEASLPPASYRAYAWTNDFTRGGLYSKAVTCGLGAGCDDHMPLDFIVSENRVTEGIDVCDWYAGPFQVPYPPDQDRAGLTGVIAGALGYPGGATPRLRVYAINLDTDEWVYYEFKEGQTSYTIPNLPPGRYYVLAYDPDGQAGAYASASHQLREVAVRAGGTTEGVDITDWYAPEGTFPQEPGK